MTQSLTQADVAQLQAYATAGDRYDYWSYLANLGDPYATLALGVATDETQAGFIANAYFTSVAESDGVQVTPQLLNQVGVDLMELDLKARINDVAENGTGLNLGVAVIEGYHATAFNEATGGEVGISAWTAYAPLQQALQLGATTGDYTQANAIWQEMVSGNWADYPNLAADGGPAWTAQVGIDTAAYLAATGGGLATNDVSYRNLNEIDGYQYLGNGLWWQNGTAIPADPQLASQLNAIQALRQQEFGSNALSSTPPFQCFSAGTPILSADGATRPIEDIAIGDRVLAFDPRDPADALKPARVTRLFRNVTEEWLVLDNGLTVTPGHLFLNERGDFERIDSLLARGGGIVGADGAAQAATAQRVVYCEATRALYEEAEQAVAASSGALALQPQIARGLRSHIFS